MIPTLITDNTAKLGRILAEGGIVIFPTETVYGIGADSTNFEACQKIYAIKQRPLDNPLIAHFESIQQIESYCELPSLGRVLLAAFSPGPLTLILKIKQNPIFTLGLNTLAVRIPNHPGALDLLHEAGVPISAPSANPSGKPSFTREKDVIQFFDGKVDGILKANEPSIGIESTVLDLSKEVPVLLRPGHITREDLLPYLPDLSINTELSLNTEIRSPGMKYRHYSPEAKVILLDVSDFQKTWQEQGFHPRCAFIGFHFESNRPNDKKIMNNTEYMKSLYSFFLDSDAFGMDVCYCEKPMLDSFYSPLMNRLSKAASKV